MHIDDETDENLLVLKNGWGSKLTSKRENTKKQSNKKKWKWVSR